MPKYVKTREDAAKSEKKKEKKKGNKGKSFMEKVRNRRRELESGDARGGKRTPKNKKKQRGGY